MKKDFEQYLLKVQHQYEQMQKAVDEANDLIAEGHAPEGAYEQVFTQMQAIDANYKRLMYAKYLYTLPPKFIQRIQKRRLEKEQKKYQEQHADKDQVVYENDKNLYNISKSLETEVDEDVE